VKALIEVSGYMNALLIRFSKKKIRVPKIEHVKKEKTTVRECTHSRLELYECTSHSLLEPKKTECNKQKHAAAFLRCGILALC